MYHSLVEMLGKSGRRKIRNKSMYLCDKVDVLVEIEILNLGCNKASQVSE